MGPQKPTGTAGRASYDKCRHQHDASGRCTWGASESDTAPTDSPRTRRSVYTRSSCCAASVLPAALISPTATRSDLPPSLSSRRLLCHLPSMEVRRAGGTSPGPVLGTTLRRRGLRSASDPTFGRRFDRGTRALPVGSRTDLAYQPGRVPAVVDGARMRLPIPHLVRRPRASENRSGQPVQRLAFGDDGGGCEHGGERENRASLTRQHHSNDRTRTR
jgi:hypothetical protein